MSVCSPFGLIWCFLEFDSHWFREKRSINIPLNCVFYRRKKSYGLKRHFWVKKILYNLCLQACSFVLNDTTSAQWTIRCIKDSFHKAQAEFYIKALVQVVSAVKETLLRRGESFNTPEKADPNLPCPSFSSVCDTLSHTRQGRAWWSARTLACYYKTIR